MRKTGVLLVGLVLLSGCVLAGEVITNDTGEQASGLRVTFSVPVEITGFGDALVSVDPQVAASEFIFSGGAVEAWGSHWISWSPATASVIEYEWLGRSLPSSLPEDDLSREDLLNLGRTPTYDEIMSVIAEYPGPDEPLYEPAPDEAIWLTDLEGHADIYDNDSIKINYADWFDQSQITTIEVYRNGIKMQFLPDTLDVLTNDQMKTFDGNPLEHTPASNHTDHAIFGYEYEFRFFDAPAHAIALLPTWIQNPVSLSGTYRSASISGSWFKSVAESWKSDADVKAFLAKIAAFGFQSIEFEIKLYLQDDHSTGVFQQRVTDPEVCNEWNLTADDEDVLDLMRWAKEAGLDTELTLQLWVADGYKETHGYSDGLRSFIVPDDLEDWFEAYRQQVSRYAQIAEEGEAKFFRPVVEFNLLQKHTEWMNRLLAEAQEWFSGELVVADPIHHTIYGKARREEGYFWDHPNLVHGLNCWRPVLSESPDARYSQMAEAFYNDWEPTVSQLRRAYPSTPITFSEIGFYNFDGSSSGNALTREEAEKEIRDDQELADVWAIYLLASEALGLDGICVWTFQLAYPVPMAGSSCVYDTSAVRIISSFLKDRVQSDAKSWFAPMLKEQYSLALSPRSDLAAESPVSSVDQTDLTREGLMNLDRAPTYEEIMSVIAEYPGEDEPLYEPAPDEAIWLTDLEGHADIYDNDSIKINYADWFDQSQISTIKVYRNGVKMQFLPDTLDVLTNEQMKTFDGNPLERTPASSHTDHAILGYEFEIRFVGDCTSLLACMPLRIQNPVQFDGVATAQVGVFWNYFHKSDAELIADLESIRELGFSAAQTQIYYFMEDPFATSLFSLPAVDLQIAPDWARTLSDAELHRALRLIQDAGLKADLRIELWISRAWKDTHGGSRSSIAPSSVAEWFSRYQDICLHGARIAETEGCETLCVGVELNSMEQYTSYWESLANSIRGVFSGNLTFSESTHHYLTGVDSFSGVTTLEQSIGRFWGSLDYIGMNCWRNPPLEDRPDQRYSQMTERFVDVWSDTFLLYSSEFPGVPIQWAEIGTLKHDGQAMGPPRGGSALIPDYQEAADIWAAYMNGASLLDADGVSVWRVALESHPEWIGADSHTINPYPPLKIVESFLKDRVSPSAESWFSDLVLAQDWGEIEPAHTPAQSADDLDEELVDQPSHHIVDNFQDGDLTSELGSSWQFGEWGNGKLTGQPRIESSDGVPYLLIESNGLQSVGALLNLDSIDLSPFEVFSLSIDADGRMDIVVELFHEDSSWPEGGQYAAYTNIEVLPGRQEYVLPLSGFHMAEEDIADCIHCTADFAFDDVDVLMLYMDGGDGVLRIYDVLFRK